MKRKDANPKKNPTMIMLDGGVVVVGRRRRLGAAAAAAAVLITAVVIVSTTLPSVEAWTNNNAAAAATAVPRHQQQQRSSPSWSSSLVFGMATPTPSSSSSSSSSSSRRTTFTTTTRTTSLLQVVSTSTSTVDNDPSTTEAATSDFDDNDDTNNNNNNMPPLGDDGVYQIATPAQHAALLQAHSDKLVVLKVFAPWCRACKGLEPKFVQIAHDEQYKDLPLVWASLSIQHNKAFVKALGVLALPTVQFYVAGALYDNFPCGPSKLPILKRKLATLVNDHIDPSTKQVKESSIAYYQAQLADNKNKNEDGDNIAIDTQEDAPTQNETMTMMTPPVAQGNTVGASSLVDLEAGDTPQPVGPSLAERHHIRTTIPYFSEMSLADADAVLDKARLLQFEPASIIMREGKPGRTFYVIRKGEVEILQATTMFGLDPMVVPSSYLGTVINRLTDGDYFGERALITGEPRAASLRASGDAPVECWALDRDDFPHSSPLSGRSNGLLYGSANAAALDVVNDKYGVYNDTDLASAYYDNQVKASSMSNQIRGSVNQPAPIRGVDTDDDIDVDDDEVDDMEDGKNMIPPILASPKKDADVIFSVLRRFQLIRQVSRGVDYIMETRAQWGTEGLRARRKYLVQRLSPSQRADLRETFRLIDASGDGLISLLELKRVMDSIGESKTDTELLSVMNNASLDGRQSMNYQDFEGLMAEAEFYNLFREIFATLDKNDSGFVKAGELDRVLQGVRDLIAEYSSKSLIDVDDPDMLVDYERFSRMLLGTALI